MDGKVKVWDVVRGVCVVMYSEMDKVLWCVCWLLLIECVFGFGMGKGERFCVVGVSWSLSFYWEVMGI